MLSSLPIAAVERDTGLSKDTLRIWERRYGFPSPIRDALGERSYPAEQIEKLRLLKRLLDAGHRPGRVVVMSLPVLQQLVHQGPQVVAGADAATVQDHMDLIAGHDTAALRRELSACLSRVGLTGFICEVAGPLIAEVGDAWMRGRLQVFEEHLFTEVMQGVLRQALNDIPDVAPDARPRVLLATLPGEPHGLGLLMAEGLLAQEGCRCTSLGPQAPLWDVSLAAQALQADVVGLSFTGCIGPNQVVQSLTELRARLPAATALWAGGNAPVLQRRPLPGVQALPGVSAVTAALQRWREEHQPAAPAGALPRMQA